MNNRMRDLAYSLRVLRKAPFFTLMVVAVLALGIGANTAVFSVVNSVLLRPLPFPDSDRLVIIWETNPSLNVERDGPSGPNYLDWKEQNRSFEEMALLEVGTGTLIGQGEPQQFPGLRVSTNMLTMLGAKPILGRSFTAADGEGASRHNVAVLSYGFWQRQFGGDPAVVGKKVNVNHQIYECIGVLPENLWVPVKADAFVPWPEQELRGRSRTGRDFGVLARLKPGVTVEQAQRDMDGISARIAQQYPRLEGWKTVVVPMQNAVVEYIRPALYMLLASVVFVLLLACANVANLLLARMTTRQREVGIRAAMGAGRGSLIRQFLTENLVVSLLGGVAGLLLAFWGVDLMTRVLPKTIPLPNAAAEVVLPSISVDYRVLLFAVLVSLGCSIVFGLAPAIQGSRVDLNSVLKDGARGSSGDAGHRSMRRLLVISESALAFLLLMGAALTMRSFYELSRVNPGFRSDDVLTFRLRLPTDAAYQTRDQQATFAHNVLDQVKGIAGLQAAGVTNIVPLGQEGDRTSFTLPDRAETAAQVLMTDFRNASPGFFEAMGMRLMQGRGISEFDTVDRPGIVVIDETFARRYFPNENPIGRHVGLNVKLEIVGVVAAVRHYGLDQPPRPTIYTSYLQYPQSRMSLVVRSTADRARMVAAVKNAVWAVDRDQPVFMIRTMDEYVRFANSAPRLALMLLSVFALVALALAAFGIYGVVSYTVSQRTREFGLRMALGARPYDVRQLVLMGGLRWVAIGLAAGIAGTLVLAPVLRSYLFGVSALDPLVLAVTTVTLLGIAALANYLPARRATRIDPMVALRYE